MAVVITKLLLFLIVPLGIQMSFCMAQPAQPVKWLFKSGAAEGPEVTLTFTAAILPGWHLYSQLIEEGGPFPTRFSFEPNRAYEHIGKVTESGKPFKFFDNNFMIDIIWYSDSVTFSQRIRLNQGFTTVRGKVEFMVCNSHMCLPADEMEFSIEVTPWKKSP